LDLPPHQNGLKLGNVEQVDLIIGSIPTANSPPYEALHIDASELMKKAMKGIKLCTW